MAMIRKSAAEMRGFTLSEAQQARLKAMSEEDIQRQAESDPDALPATDEELERARLSRKLRQLRR